MRYPRSWFTVTNPLKDFQKKIKCSILSGALFERHVEKIRIFPRGIYGIFRGCFRELPTILVAKSKSEQLQASPKVATELFPLANFIFPPGTNFSFPPAKPIFSKKSRLFKVRAQILNRGLCSKSLRLVPIVCLRRSN